MSTASTSLPHTPEPIATVRQYIESFNNGDPKGMAAINDSWRIASWAWTKGTAQAQA